MSMALGADLHPYLPDHAVPPGETLAEVLEARGMSQAELSRRTGISTKHINQIIAGSAPITAETALKLERVTGLPAHFWATLEADYEVQVVRATEGKSLESDADWLGTLPASELQNREWIPKSSSTAEQVRGVLA